MDGIVYILNQTGMALAQAQAEIARLNAENKSLRESASHVDASS